MLKNILGPNKSSGDLSPVDNKDPIKGAGSKRVIYRPPGYGPPGEPDGVYPWEKWKDQKLAPEHPGSAGPADNFRPQVWK